MGLLDTIKGLFGLNKGNAAPPQMGGHEHQHAEAEASSDDDSGSSGGSDEEHFDTAGFDGDDEETFFNAVLHMESDGEYGGTDESRAEIMARFGIRDRSHWQTVKSSVYTLLIRKHGSMDEVGQREMNWRTGQMQQMMQKRVSGAAASGKLKPVEGVSLEQWAAINASIAGGGNAEDLIKGAGIDQGRWDRASAEWNNRMSTDTTFAVATAYGDAFQKVSKGKYGDYAREAMAARAAHRELAWSATHDPLTGLLNRRALEAELQRLLPQVRAESPAAALFIDLDHFKAVNDSAGHAVGDRLLREVALALAATVRRDELVARLGGDEFVIVLMQCDLDSAVRVADKARAAVERIELQHEDQLLQVGASVGVVPIAPGCSSVAQVMQAADAACYAAKAEGRNRVHADAGPLPGGGAAPAES